MKNSAIVTAVFAFVLSLSMAAFVSAQEYRSTTSKAAELSNSEALELEGAPVISNTGKPIGTNEEIVFHMTGQPSYLLLSRPEQIGVIPIPIERIQVVKGTQGRHWFSVDYNEETILNAPVFDSVDAFKMPGGRVQVRSYFDME